MMKKSELSEKSLAKDSYFVAVKLLLRKGSKLLIIHDIFGAWDIPGGRIRNDQFSEPLESILKAKVTEELGEDLEYELKGIEATFRVERKEAGLDNKKVRVFAVGYEAEYVRGEVKLGDHHDKLEWIDLNSVNLEDYASPGGWVEQLKDYRERVINNDA